MDIWFPQFQMILEPLWEIILKHFARDNKNDGFQIISFANNQKMYNESTLFLMNNNVLNSTSIPKPKSVECNESGGQWTWFCARLFLNALLALKVFKCLKFHNMNCIDVPRTPKFPRDQFYWTEWRFTRQRSNQLQTPQPKPKSLKYCLFTKRLSWCVQSVEIIRKSYTGLSTIEMQM